MFFWLSNLVNRFKYLLMFAVFGGLGSQFGMMQMDGFDTSSLSSYWPLLLSMVTGILLTLVRFMVRLLTAALLLFGAYIYWSGSLPQIF